MQHTSTAIVAMRVRVFTVAEPMCGSTTQFSRVSRGCDGGKGSGTVTSIPKDTLMASSRLENRREDKFRVDER